MTIKECKELMAEYEDDRELIVYKPCRTGPDLVVWLQCDDDDAKIVKIEPKYDTIIAWCE